MADKTVLCSIQRLLSEARFSKDVPDNFVKNLDGNLSCATDHLLQGLGRQESEEGNRHNPGHALSYPSHLSVFQVINTAIYTHDIPILSNLLTLTGTIHDVPSLNHVTSQYSG